MIPEKSNMSWLGKKGWVRGGKYMAVCCADNRLSLEPLVCRYHYMPLRSERGANKFVENGRGCGRWGSNDRERPFLAFAGPPN